MSEAAVEIDACTHLAVVAVSNVSKCSLIVRIASTEDDDLHSVVEHFLQDVKQKIQTLLIDQTGDHGAERRTRIDVQT